MIKYAILLAFWITVNKLKHPSRVYRKVGAYVFIDHRLFSPAMACYVYYSQCAILRYTFFDQKKDHQVGFQLNKKLPGTDKLMCGYYTKSVF